MTTRERKGLVAAAVGLALVAAVMFARSDAPDAAVRPQPVRGRTAAAAAEVPVVDVRLDALRDAPSRPLEDVERNLFRFESRQGQDSAPPPVDAEKPPGVLPPRPVAIGPPSAPAIPLRYIGLLDAPSQSGLVAVLSDGRGNVFYGRAGDVIEGRYQVIQVTPVALEISQLDGRGRQTIRLAGQ